MEKLGRLLHLLINGIWLFTAPFTFRILSDKSVNKHFRDTMNLFLVVRPPTNQSVKKSLATPSKVLCIYLHRIPTLFKK